MLPARAAMVAFFRYFTDCAHKQDGLDGRRVLAVLMTTLARRLKARGRDVVFISVLDSEPFVYAAQPSLIPYCEKEIPRGSVRQIDK